MIELYVFLSIWCGLGVSAWVFIEWFSITKKYRAAFLREELRGIHIWQCLGISMLFGPLTWLMLLPHE